MSINKHAALRILILSIAIPLLSSSTAVTAQNAQLNGTVSLPPTKVKKKRVFRGSEYRSRLSTSKGPTKQTAPTRRSRFDDVVVSLHPLSFKADLEPQGEPPRLDQRDVTFAPRVLPFVVGSDVEFVNNDKVYHNVLSLTPGADFDIGRKPTGEVATEKIEMVGKIELFCDIHPQMNATLLSLDTPFFTRPDSAGGFAIEELPAGRYEVRVFHPDYDGVAGELTLGAGDAVTRHFAVVD